MIGHRLCARSRNTTKPRATPRSFDPSKKDGLNTRTLDINKTNWALKLDRPPFVAYSATGGITFSFGGLKIDEHARVIGTDWRPIHGLYTCGEMVGGLFHDNYSGRHGTRVRGSLRPHSRAKRSHRIVRQKRIRRRFHARRHQQWRRLPATGSPGGSQPMGRDFSRPHGQP